ncbi:hypothetical protein ACH4VS_30490 [Streptomyces hygroscopicus]|uniref:hypothetical protein n=1 Tax=Streptomyces hygroscopicus TaxID=1912 RepID=UPI0007677482|nr:hypothetical protein [Streptomyces hygroscopicus]GLV77860.1 hypothetical protein Shyhy02_58600 [Streptomyces hygroscopicus subsp. hygroscopicus]
MAPLTEHRLVSGPVVYGFLRLVRVSPARQEALTASLAEFCRSHELQLSGVLSDREVNSGPASAAFTGLLDVLAIPDVYGVIAPAMSHLGPKAIAAERRRRIEATGSRLLLIRPARPKHPSVSRSGPARRRSPATTRVLDPES